MIRSLAVFSAAVALAAPAVAAAQSTESAALIDELKSFCVASQANGPAALALADKAGWSPVPDAMLKSFSARLKNAQGRMKSDASGIQFMMTGSGSFPAGPATLDLNLCAIGAGATDPDAVEAAVQSLAGSVQPMSLGEAGRMWIYAEAAGGHQGLSASDPAAAMAAVRAGTLRAFMNQTLPNALMPKGLSLVGYAAPPS